MICCHEKMANPLSQEPRGDLLTMPFSIALKTWITRVHRPPVPPQAEEWFSRPVFTCSLSWCLRKPQLGPYGSACLVSHVMIDTHTCWTRNTVPRLALFPLSWKSSVVRNYYVSGKLWKGLYWLFTRNLLWCWVNGGGGAISNLLVGTAEMKCLVEGRIQPQYSWRHDLMSHCWFPHLLTASITSQVFLVLYRHAYVNICPSTSVTGYCDNQARWWPWNYLENGHMLWTQNYDFNYASK